MSFTTFSNQVGAVVKARGPSSWFSPHMAAAARAIAKRIHLVDFAVEVRDARIPLSSAFEPMKRVSCAHRRIILLNKADLSDNSKTEKWIEHFRENNCYCYAVNAHNKENIKQLINFSRARIREMGVDENYTATFMLMGIPNVGKSALVNALHQIGRISAEEKGKLKHADVTSRPGDTKDISSYKIASHPNIYVLDTPGVLPPEMIDLEVGSKLALTGANDDSLIGVNELAQYFLALLNLGDQYKCWQKLNAKANEESDLEAKCQTKSHPGKNMKRRYPSDHTQDFVVHEVRRTLYNAITSFAGKLEDATEMSELIKAQFLALHSVFRVPQENKENGDKIVATKLLNLYRTGRLGRYTLDDFPDK